MLLSGSVMTTRSCVQFDVPQHSNFYGHKDQYDLFDSLPPLENLSESLPELEFVEESPSPAGIGLPPPPQTKSYDSYLNQQNGSQTTQENDVASLMDPFSDRFENESTPAPQPIPEEAPTSSSSEPQTNPMSKEQRMQCARREIIETEKRYVEQMEEACNVIAPSLLKVCVTHYCDQTRAIQGMLETIPRICDLSKNLLEALEARDCANSSLEMANVFMEFLQFFKSYGSYCACHSISQIFLQELNSQKKYSKFAEATDKLVGKKKMKRVTFLEGYFILPTQRIPRYMLLLKNLAKLTPETDAAYSQLEDAAALATEVAHFVNDTVRLKMQREGVVLVSNLFDVDPNFVHPARYFVGKGVLRVLTQKSKEPHEHSFFLFNNMLAYARGGRKLKLAGTFDLTEDCEIRTLPPKFGWKNAFQLVNSEERELVLIARDEKYMVTWMKCIKSAIRKLSEPLPTQSPVPHHRRKASPQQNLLQRALTGNPPLPATPPPTRRVIPPSHQSQYSDSSISSPITSPTQSPSISPRKGSSRKGTPVPRARKAVSQDERILQHLARFPSFVPQGSSPSPLRKVRRPANPLLTPPTPYKQLERQKLSRSQSDGPHVTSPSSNKDRTMRASRTMPELKSHHRGLPPPPTSATSNGYQQQQHHHVTPPTKPRGLPPPNRSTAFSASHEKKPAYHPPNPNIPAQRKFHRGLPPPNNSGHNVQILRGKVPPMPSKVGLKTKLSQNTQEKKEVPLERPPKPTAVLSLIHQYEKGRPRSDSNMVLSLNEALQIETP